MIDHRQRLLVLGQADTDHHTITRQQPAQPLPPRIPLPVSPRHAVAPGPATGKQDGHAIELPSVTQRRLLAVLALHAPNRVRAERLAEVLGVSPGVLRTSVSRLRKALGDQAPVSFSGGNQLRAAVDAQLFCQAVAAVSAGPRQVRADASLTALEEPLGLWAGPAFEEAADEECRARAPGMSTESP
jgi:hypothetical protein